MNTTDWATLAKACPITPEALPLSRTPEEQLRFLREYLERARATGDYECYECVEHIVARLEVAAESPFMDA
jgi:hypothetical protein